ncbi:MAG: glutaredoxin 3, partial [Dongiaceae bacterium]
ERAITMAKVEIYTTQFCGYCHAAKRLLAERGAEYAEIDVMADPQSRAEMVQRAGGRRTVPQVFIDGKYIGGCDELHALDRRGGLTPLLLAAG